MSTFADLYDHFLTLISKKVAPGHLNTYFSSNGHFHFEKVHFINTHENKIR